MTRTAKIILASLAVALSGAGHATTYIDKTSNDINMAYAGGEYNATTVLTRTINIQGKWTITAKASLVGYEEDSLARCALYQGSTRLDYSTAEIGWRGGFSAVATVTNLAQVFVPKGGSATISMKCWHDASATMKVDPQATMIITNK